MQPWAAVARLSVEYTFPFNHINHFLFDNATTLSFTGLVRKTPWP